MNKATDTSRTFYDTKLRRIFFTSFIVTAALGGIFLRFYAMSKGNNYDFESYKIVGDIVARGANVYAETARYNYGPVWFSILGLFREVGMLFTQSDFTFRILIVSFLTLVDILIAGLLCKKYGLVAATIFFLNPVSIAITGYHNQFDNLAILIGLVGLWLMPQSGADTVTKRHVYAAAVIGLSLMTKHIFFLLPLWLYIREKDMKVKSVVLLIPLTMFGLSFVPFIFNNGLSGIIQNVFLYKSFANAPLLNAIFSQGIVVLTHPTVVLLLGLILVGFMTRRLPAFEAGLWYLIALVVLSPAIANQYLTIVAPAIAALGIVFFIPFLVLATLLLWGTSKEGVHLNKIFELIPDKLLPYISPSSDNGQYKLIIFSLFLGAVAAAILRYRAQWYVKSFEQFKKVIVEQLEQLKSR